MDIAPISCTHRAAQDTAGFAGHIVHQLKQRRRHRSSHYFVDIARLVNPPLVVIDNNALADAVQRGGLRMFPVVRFAWKTIGDPQFELGSHLLSNLLIEGKDDDLLAQRNLVGALRDQCRLA